MVPHRGRQHLGIASQRLLCRPLAQTHTAVSPECFYSFLLACLTPLGCEHCQCLVVTSILLETALAPTLEGRGEKGRLWKQG